MVIVPRRSLPAVLAGLAASVAGCSGVSKGSRAGPVSSSIGAPSSGPVPSAGPAPTKGSVPGQVTTITRKLTAPWGLTFLPDHSALVSQRDNATIVHIPAGGGAAQPVGTVPGVAHGGEGGLLGLAVSPGFAADRTLFAYRTTETGNEVVAMTVGPDLRSLSAPRVVLAGIDRARVHNGGRIAFGPDGDLFIGTGDATRRERAPDDGSLNGKVLRIRPDGSIPAGNPFGTAVFTTGHRNVQGLAFGPGGVLYAAEFGQDTWDELNVLAAGANYGWPDAEGPNGAGGIRPLFWFPTDQASPSGIAYAGGAVWMAALRGQRLWRLPVSGGKRTGEPVAYLDGRYGRLRTVAVAPDGALWLTTSNTDGRGSPADGDDRILRIPLVPAG